MLAEQRETLANAVASMSSGIEHSTATPHTARQVSRNRSCITTTGSIGSTSSTGSHTFTCGPTLETFAAERVKAQQHRRRAWLVGLEGLLAQLTLERLPPHSGDRV